MEAGPCGLTGRGALGPPGPRVRAVGALGSGPSDLAGDRSGDRTRTIRAHHVVRSVLCRLTLPTRAGGAWRLVLNQEISSRTRSTPMARQEILDQITQNFGFVPGLMELMPDPGLEQSWTTPGGVPGDSK